MSEQGIVTVRDLTASQIDNPALWELLKRYMGEVAPPCVVEALMKTLDPNCVGRVWRVSQREEPP